MEVRPRHVTGGEAGDRMGGARRWRFNMSGGSVVVVQKLGFKFFGGGGEFQRHIWL
jgi:hypothetical protein